MADLSAAIAAARDALEGTYPGNDAMEHGRTELRALLAALDAQEPVAWQLRIGAPGFDSWGKWVGYESKALRDEHAEFHRRDNWRVETRDLYAAPQPQASAEDVLVRAYFHRFSDVEDDYTIYHTLDGVCEQCIPVLIVRASLEVGRE